MPVDPRLGRIVGAVVRLYDHSEPLHRPLSPQPQDSFSLARSRRRPQRGGTGGLELGSAGRVAKRFARSRARFAASGRTRNAVSCSRGGVHRRRDCRADCASARDDSQSAVQDESEAPGSSRETTGAAMNTEKIDDQIREYYASQRPSPQTVARVKQMMRAGAPVRPRRRLWIGVAAAVAIAVTTLIWTAARRVLPSPQQVAASVARQAAFGHNEKQELEFRVTTCAELQRKMRSLDFTLVEPAMMKEMNMRIVGARYATLAGEMAAQIVYVDSHGVT